MKSSYLYNAADENFSNDYYSKINICVLSIKGYNKSNKIVKLKIQIRHTKLKIL